MRVPVSLMGALCAAFVVGDGRVPVHAFVAMRTDWSKKWPDDAAMQNRDKAGVAHYPGWSMPVLKLLYEDRKIAASARNDYTRG
jgi:kynurenine formamidase